MAEAIKIPYNDSVVKCTSSDCMLTLNISYTGNYKITIGPLMAVPSMMSNFEVRYKNATYSLSSIKFMKAFNGYAASTDSNPVKEMMLEFANGSDKLWIFVPLVKSDETDVAKYPDRSLYVKKILGKMQSMKSAVPEVTSSELVFQPNDYIRNGMLLIPEGGVFVYKSKRCFYFGLESAIELSESDLNFINNNGGGNAETVGKVTPKSLVYNSVGTYRVNGDDIYIDCNPTEEEGGEPTSEVGGGVGSGISGVNTDGVEEDLNDGTKKIGEFFSNYWPLLSIATAFIILSGLYIKYFNPNIAKPIISALEKPAAAIQVIQRGGRSRKQRGGGPFDAQPSNNKSNKSLMSSITGSNSSSSSSSSGFMSQSSSMPMSSITTYVNWLFIGIVVIIGGIFIWNKTKLR